MPDFLHEQKSKTLPCFYICCCIIIKQVQETQNKRCYFRGFPFFSFHVFLICSLHMSLFVLPVSDEEVVNCNFFQHGGRSAKDMDWFTPWFSLSVLVACDQAAAGWSVLLLFVRRHFQSSSAPFISIHLPQLQTAPACLVLSCASSVSGMIFLGSASSAIAQ